MNNTELVLHRQRLLMRSSELRLTLKEQAGVFKKPFAVADHARDGLQWIARNPKWPLGVLLVIIVLRPRRAIVWSNRLWWGWQMFKRAQNLIATLPLAKRSP